MTEKLFSFSATETGYNHIKTEPSKACEDASGFYDDLRMRICVVADGHGSDNYPRTDRGSQFAVDAALKQIRTFVSSIYNPDPENAELSKKESKELIDKLLYTDINETHLLKNLSQSILKKWYEYVECDVEENPFQESEMTNVAEKYKRKYLSENVNERRVEKAYGCTLIAYVVTEDFSFGIQIGDGKCVVIDQNGTISEPIPWDENCQLNVTTSICDSDASDEFRFFVTNGKPAAVFCGSDGIDDSYANVEEIYELYRSILKVFVEHGIEVGKSEIKEYLPILTKKGSGDDVSIALVMDIQRVAELAPVFTVQTELFNLENQLKEHRHAAVVNEEKEKALSAELSARMYPGNKSSMDSDIINQVDDLRLQRTQLDKEILTVQRKIEDLNSRMPVIIAECGPDMSTMLIKKAEGAEAVVAELENESKITTVLESMTKELGSAADGFSETDEKEDSIDAEVLVPLDVSRSISVVNKEEGIKAAETEEKRKTKEV